MSTPPVADTPHQLPEFPPGTSIAPTARPSTGKKVKKVLGIVLVAVVAFFAFGYYIQDDPSIAEVGNCVHNSGSSDKPKVAIVDCGAADADFKVLKVVRNTSDTKACESVEEVEAAYLEESSDPFVLCLGKNH
ncbi:hypothetical protein OG689_07450 [Kitasatospora sp. NBC_00240]|uniref:LppU/SCO3897 family protein n=1 Tax=Kitasatospora sp. NBC_00240 TaxID=2903567 RepID=UPI002254C4E8|nr:hypothetical protein [Kitasatospora sp. NBC_00240]MCX5209122.1 hypothetical protein [Kitasatospora sp. NBC_00240]